MNVNVNEKIQIAHKTKLAIANRSR